jgi:hypothetical protein
MRYVAFACALLAVAIPAASAQDAGKVSSATVVVQPPYQIDNLNLGKYCIFNDKVYSKGAVICAPKSTMLTCTGGGEWASARTASTGECNENPGLTPQ